MPSPIGHALGGVIVGLASDGRDRSFLTVCAVAACLPDLDFLWGRHNMETHSLGCAVMVGGLAWAWGRSGPKRRHVRDDKPSPVSRRLFGARLGFACALAVASHVLFDWLGSDDTPPLGVMALWPLTSSFYFADASIFDAISRRYWLSNFVSHNTLAIGREVAILLPPAVALWWFRGSRFQGS